MSGDSGGYFSACDVDPYAYLRHILAELPRRQPGDDVSDLLPFNYAKQQMAVG